MKSVLLFTILVLGLTGQARGDASRDAGKHFQRGVELYNDGDFRGALVEFKKAYATWPRANVLYDIGQTEYQLLEYAAALKTMERYLAETGPNAAHRAEVESTTEVLRGRVGRIALTVDAEGCEVTVDDQAHGTTPLEQPLLVAVGARRLTVACMGRAPSVRQVEVAAGETVTVVLKLPPPPVATVRVAPVPVETKAPPSRRGFTAAWTLTGLLFAATVGIGSAALVEQSRLTTLKGTFPVTRATLDQQASLTTNLAITADVLGVVTLAGAALSTYLTIKYGRERKSRVAWLGPALRASF